MNSELPVRQQQVRKVIRQFPQKQPVADNAGQAKPRLSMDVLAGVSVCLLTISFFFFFSYKHMILSFMFVAHYSLCRHLVVFSLMFKNQVDASRMLSR